VTSRRAAAGIAAAFLVLHLPFQAPSLEDLDSVNFALGLRDFDVGSHQPHPPGYPVFMFVAKGAFALIGSEVRALSLTSLASGAVAVFPLVAFFGVLDRQRPASTIAAASLVIGSPLYWLTAVRPLSDAMGLAAVLAVQALLVTARTPRALAVAAVAAGLAAGVRSQAVWLTLPLLAFVSIAWAADARYRVGVVAAAAYGTGVLVWALPLTIVTGGPSAYWDALTTQGVEDFTGVAMLLTSFSPRLALNALRDTFVAPWASWLLAAPVLVVASVGALAALARDRRPLVLLAVSFGPYLCFHLLLQETFTTRYALPLVVPVAWLAVRGLATIGRPGIAVASVMIAASLGLAQSALMAYGRAPAPAFRLLADMSAQAPGRAAPVLAMHRRGAFDFRRPLLWVGDAMPPLAGRLESPPKLEWLEAVKYWNSGGRSPVWFIADPLRSDLALIDHDGPRASYRWPFPAALVGGARPDTIDWYVLDEPAWYLGEGWALTPETAGVAAENGRGPGRAPIEGWIKRSHAGVSMMIGGRNLDDAGPAANVQVSVDDQVRDEWVAAPGFFLRWLTLDGLEGPGDYARVAVTADLPALAVEQFDAQPSGALMQGYAEGWYELEYNPILGRLWRWTSQRALIEVRTGSQDLVLRLEGESDPSADRPRVLVRAGERTLLDERVEGLFAFEVPVPAAALGDGGSAVLSIETDQTHVPAERSRRSSDRRRLGLKIYSAVLRPAS
jgi:hypothetical protein